MNTIASPGLATLRIPAQGFLTVVREWVGLDSKTRVPVMALFWPSRIPQFSEVFPSSCSGTLEASSLGCVLSTRTWDTGLCGLGE